MAPTQLWSQADEIRFLEALAAHAKQHGKPPKRAELRKALKGCPLDMGFDLCKMYEKMRRLKKVHLRRLRNSAGFAPGSHEARKYAISSIIWGNTPSRRGLEEMSRLYPNLAHAVDRIAGRSSLGDGYKRAFQLMEDEQASKLEAHVKTARIHKAKLAMKRATLMNEVLGTLIKHLE